MVLAAAFVSLQVAQITLSQADRLSVFRKALHHQASRLKGSVNLYAVSAYDSEMHAEPFERLRPLLADFPAPVTDLINWGAKKPTFLLSAGIQDVIDPTHVIVGTGADTGDQGMPIESQRLVLLKTTKGWTVTQPTLPTKDENAILRSAMLFLLSHKEYGYGRGWEGSRVKGTIPYVTCYKPMMLTQVDPSPAMMSELWSRGYHVRPMSELPNPSPPGHPPPYCSFAVGDIQAIDSRRALVLISQTFFSMEPGYNVDYGPSTSHEANYMVVKHGNAWRVGQLRGYWRLIPAE